MAREFAKKFYNSKAWRDCKASYIKKMPVFKRGLCEICNDKGIHELGVELHHKTWLRPSNIDDKNITLNHNNLILLCYECHKKQHNQRREQRFKYDSVGNILPPSEE